MLFILQTTIYSLAFSNEYIIPGFILEALCLYSVKMKTVNHNTNINNNKNSDIIILLVYLN